jgi:hypothetical protein
VRPRYFNVFSFFFFFEGAIWFNESSLSGS